MSPIDDLLAQQLPSVIALFRSKARDYSERSGIFTADLLGARGQFAEIWRKIPKLKKGMWDGEVLENESVREILQDIIGHCLLALDFDAKDAEKIETNVLAEAKWDVATGAPGFGEPGNAARRRFGARCTCPSEMAARDRFCPKHGEGVL
jgi:hypothetical protein